MNFKILYDKALTVAKERTLSPTAVAGSVGAAILTDKNNLYTGVCIDTACSMGFCAEHAAAAAMITAGEHQIIKMIAVRYDGTIVSPCGRCREFISQLHINNMLCEVKISETTVKKLSELLPNDWKS